jgi:hypothetical protein
VAFPKRQSVRIATNQKSVPKPDDGTGELKRQTSSRLALSIQKGLSRWCAGRRIKRRRRGVRSSRVRQCEPSDRRGCSQDRGRAAGQHRHVRDVADGASSFRAGRVGVPKCSAHRDGKDGHQSNHERCPVRPSKLLPGVVHDQARTVTLKMLTQTPAAGKRSPKSRTLVHNPANQVWVGSGTIERGWRSTAGGSGTARGPGSAAGDAACRAASERSS